MENSRQGPRKKQCTGQAGACRGGWGDLPRFAAASIELCSAGSINCINNGGAHLGAMGMKLRGDVYGLSGFG
jgi:hypothetical protein